MSTARQLSYLNAFLKIHVRSVLQVSSHISFNVRNDDVLSIFFSPEGTRKYRLVKEGESEVISSFTGQKLVPGKMPARAAARYVQHTPQYRSDASRRVFVCLFVFPSSL
jgi:hypothetical protein